MKTAARALTIGDRLIYGGRACVVHGFSPMSVQPELVYLADAAEARSRDSLRVVPVDACAFAPRGREQQAA
ncbi:MAG: hypothetical protein V7644_990 [Actinomycetota bacterium]